MRKAVLLERMDPLTALLLILLTPPSAANADEIRFSGDARALQQTIQQADKGATIRCDHADPIVISKTITIPRPLTLTGLKAKLPPGLGKTPLLVVAAEGVTLTEIEMHGNYSSVTQADRAPLIWIQKGNFTVRDCKFFDGTKDGIMVTPAPNMGDIVGGTIRGIEALRMARDAVSISGGNQGQKVRNLIVEQVRLKTGYLRGPVEVSDGTDNITVRGVYAEDCRYGVDVQDHRGDSAANTNVVIEDVEAVNCRHLLRTANSPRGHAGLTLRNLTARNCEQPLTISHTTNVTLEKVRIQCRPESDSPPVVLKNCRSVRLGDLVIEGLPAQVQVVDQQQCEDVRIERLVRRGQGAQGK